MFNLNQRNLQDNLQFHLAKNGRSVENYRNFQDCLMFFTARFGKFLELGACKNKGSDVLSKGVVNNSLYGATMEIRHEAKMKKEGGILPYTQNSFTSRIWLWLESAIKTVVQNRVVKVLEYTEDKCSQLTKFPKSSCKKDKVFLKVPMVLNTTAVFGNTIWQGSLQSRKVGF